ncbi:GNAT family N-acetyltransferase [Paenarthrobacter sp. NPDC092416]|uniref:GNAT family N-acetyltransferase n=1 Tax=Paenarthrobacter sp. NPDC092416 TaxID=3364386 RepID=UPI0038180ADE
MQHDVTLSGHGISLVPLSPWHAHALHGFIDSELWAGMAASQPQSVDDLAGLFTTRLGDPGSIAFAVAHESTGQTLGTTSLTDYSHAQQRTDIGGTFFGRPYWGTPANRASKHLLLAYAFDVLDVDRVGFRCDARNTRSATAISRLGASYEGTLRSHRLAPDGTRSDTAVFSILRDEWPGVRDRLLERLAVMEWPTEQPAPHGWAA